MDRTSLASVPDPAKGGSVPPVLDSACADAPAQPTLSDAEIEAKREEFRKKVEGTNIDNRSLLSTDYFNSFNSVIMMLDMLPDTPELLEDIEQWRFIGYVDHFKSSSLDFASLAAEAYPYSPPELREAFELKVQAIRVVMEEVTSTLRRLISAAEENVFANIAHTAAARLRTMVEEGNAIVHGSSGAPTQAEIDKMF
ncbi:MAG: hypothetical protein WC464_02525 [Bdellovibrionales bacterium]